MYACYVFKHGMQTMSFKLIMHASQSLKQSKQANEGIHSRYAIYTGMLSAKRWLTAKKRKGPCTIEAPRNGYLTGAHCPDLGESLL